MALPKTKDTTPPPDDSATPLMAQYLAIKARHPDCLLFFRLGDFYEMFFEDAVKASRALDIALTRRGQHQGKDIPMCGVPFHAYENYLARLIRKGFHVAICEQTEDPAAAKKRGYKAIVAREVVRIVTPGTVTEDSLLDARTANTLACLTAAGNEMALAWLDLAAAEPKTQTVSADDLGAALARVAPSEILVPQRLIENPDLFETLAPWRDQLTPQPDSRFDSENARRRLMQTYEVKELAAFGDFSRAEVAALGALLDYAALTQKSDMKHLARPQGAAPTDALALDPATRRNLELTRTLSGERRGSLLHAIDRTETSAGARLLAARLAAPLTNIEAINSRLDSVDFMFRQKALRGSLLGELKQTPDLERALARLSLGRGGPRDLAALRDSLGRAEAIKSLLLEANTTISASEALPTPSHKDGPVPLPLREGLGEGYVKDDPSLAKTNDLLRKSKFSLSPPQGGRGFLPAALAAALRNLGEYSALADKLTRALAETLPMLTRDGGFIAKGYAPQLDELTELRDDSRRLIAGLQKKYEAESGAPSLKVRHNNVIGYYIEATPAHAQKLMDRKDLFIHRQTMAGAVRFSTVELGELERKINEAADKALAVELQLFDGFVRDAMQILPDLRATAAALAELDVTAALAELAEERTYCRPLVDGSPAFEIKGGRHPVVEQSLKDEGAGFVPNDCDLAPEKRLWLVTGPNMAGKSTFLRQNALIALLAQTGSFVPAQSAHIGVIDKLFSRVGAADDLARGRSTFMVEMVETAAILNQAGERALVILDEIGRGTATYDGLSIAWATLEHLHEVNRCRTLFATHYHELTRLADKLPALFCATMRIREWKKEIVFLHEVAPGVADRSYGIHVAQMAGLPRAVTARAEQVLARLENGKEKDAAGKAVDSLPLFSAAVPQAAPEGNPELDSLLDSLNPDENTPKEALELLYRIKALREK